jgi:hypothetical protein
MLARTPSTAPWFHPRLGFKFHWRDPIFNKGSALASLADAQRGSVDDVRRQYVDYIFNGSATRLATSHLRWQDLERPEDDERVARSIWVLPA